MRMIIITRNNISVKYKVIASSVDSQGMEAKKAISSKKIRKDRNISSNERIETQETKYVGVSWNKKRQRWVAEIQIGGEKRKYLGSFDSDYDAAMKYDEEARKHGKSVNFPIHPTDIQAEKRKKG